MPDISKITLPSGSSYDLKDKYRVHPVIGTQTQATNVWTGEIDVDELYDGIAIAYFLPYAGNSSSATLTLTLANGETTAPIAVYALNNTRATTHYGAGSTIFLTFWSAGSISVSGTATTDDRWTSFNYNSDTTINNRIANFARKTGQLGIWANGLFMEDSLGTYQNICTGQDGTVNANSRTDEPVKLANPNGFRVGGTILYTTTTYNANSNISGGSVVYSAISVIDARYSFNVIRASGQLTPYAPIYLKGTIHSDNLFYLDEIWWTQTPNEIGKIYVLVGGVFDSSTSNIRVTLYEQNDWYVYNGVTLIGLGGGEDTKNTAGATDTSSKIYLVGATEQSANPQTYSDDEVYTTSGTLTTKEVAVGGGSATMRYNSTDDSIEFVFN